MVRWRQFQLTPTQRRLLIQLTLSHLAAGALLLSVVVLVWPAGAPLPLLPLAISLLLLLAAGLGLNRNIVRQAGRLDQQLARLPAVAEWAAETRLPRAQDGLANPLQELARHFTWIETVSDAMDGAAHTDSKLAAAAAADQHDYQRVRARLRTAQAELAAMMAAGRAPAAALAQLRQELRALENELQRWHQTFSGERAVGGDEQLARWRADEPLQPAAPASPPDWYKRFDPTEARRHLKGATRALSVKATLLFLWMFFIQTARAGDVALATVVTVILSGLLLRQTERMAAVLPVAGVVGHADAQQLRLQMHWRRASSFLLDAFWFSVLLLTWSNNSGTPWLAGLWLVTGAGLIAWEGWQAVQVMDRAARPLPAGDQEAILRAARRQGRTLRSASLALILLTWVCYTQGLIAFPPHNSVTWLVTLSLVGSLTRLIPPLAATWFQYQWRPTSQRYVSGQQ